jgi:hypothetical protein
MGSVCTLPFPGGGCSDAHFLQEAILSMKLLMLTLTCTHTFAAFAGAVHGDSGQFWSSARLLLVLLSLLRPRQ